MTYPRCYTAQPALHDDALSSIAETPLFGGCDVHGMHALLDLLCNIVLKDQVCNACHTRSTTPNKPHKPTTCRKTAASLMRMSQQTRSDKKALRLTAALYAQPRHAFLTHPPMRTEHGRAARLLTQIATNEPCSAQSPQ